MSFSSHSRATVRALVWPPAVSALMLPPFKQDLLQMIGRLGGGEKEQNP